MININALAQDCFNTLNAKDKDGNFVPVTVEMIAYVQAFYTAFIGGKTNNPTVTGTGLPAAPLQSGAASGGHVTGVLASAMAAEMSSAFGESSPAKILAACEGVCETINNDSKVSFASGKITGTCGATPTSPGPLNGGAGTGGKLSDLLGPTMAALVASKMGIDLNDTLNDFHTVLCNHIINNAEVEYASGKVTGSFLAGGGSLMGGTAIDGSMS